jgi:hypothetical protein
MDESVAGVGPGSGLSCGMMNPNAWPMWLKMLVGICLVFLNLWPWWVSPRKLTNRERILCALFTAFVLSLLTVFVVGMHLAR